MPQNAAPDVPAMTYRVGFLGLPRWDGQFVYPVEWSEDNLLRLKALGFNTIQIHIAWATRPPGEPLNLEDVVALAPDAAQAYPNPLPLYDPSPENRSARAAELRRRVGLCQKHGLRTLFHFGAPYNHPHQDGSLPNCISDEAVQQRYVLLLRELARQVPGIDDLLIYTYDQYAWLCSEFDACPRCGGVPLHERLPAFLDCLANEWKRLTAQGDHPAGRLWWEPWELSAGQVYRCIEKLTATNLGMALHANIAEVQAALPVDRWFKNTCRLAQERGMPVLGEYFLGGFSEELEPLTHLASPLTTLRGLKAIAAVPGVSGIKEYYGLAPQKEDPNLRMTALFFSNPEISEGEAVRRLAESYGPAAAEVSAFWEQCSLAMEMFPWDASWCMRRLGASSPAHSLSAAILRGYQWQTPSWRANREGAFMSNTTRPPHPWMAEDVQIRCQMAAEKWSSAQLMGECLLQDIPAALRADFQKGLADLGRIKRRALAYACHLRETNLANLLRARRAVGQAFPERTIHELRKTLEIDLAIVREELSALAIEPFPCGSPVPVDERELQAALDLFRLDLDRFLDTYFLESEDQVSRGFFSVTSR
jgi:hypothetical protein